MNIKKFISDNTDSMYKLLYDLCHIPAPSHHEEKRAQFCKSWLENIGAEGVYIDNALNVIFPINCDGKNNISVIAAHTDTVFPDTESMPYREEDGKVFCPGVKDDTASVVVLMHVAKYFIENNIVPEKGVMFVCNSCEEGLGNLKGIRQLFSDFDGRIGDFITFDSEPEKVCCKSVGSHRYSVKVTTCGGHSFNAFGNPNAINGASKIVSAIYDIELPKKEGTRTTYNVGGISGGTSVNTIAQSAELLCEYRSDDLECLDFMKRRFEQIFDSIRGDEYGVEVELIGDRPCMNIDPDKHEAFRARVVPAVESLIGMSVKYTSGSTDCNIPLSLGIPALCIGVCEGKGIHTREEYLVKDSIVFGLELAINAVKKACEV